MKSNVCLGIAIGMVVGMMVATVPGVQRVANDMKVLVEKDVVEPVRDFMRYKKNKSTNNVED